MSIRRPRAAVPQPAGLLALLAREELAFRCLRARLGPAGAGPAPEFSGTLSGFPGPGGSRNKA